MILLTQTLIAETPDSTASILRHGSKFLGFIIEDGHRAVKEHGKSRIPPGEYTIQPKKEGKFYSKYKEALGHQWVPHLQDVPGFDQILIHSGNYVSDTDGCLLINSTLGYMEKANLYYGGGSMIAYKKLYAYLDLYMGDDTIRIRITR